MISIIVIFQKRNRMLKILLISVLLTLTAAATPECVMHFAQCDKTVNRLLEIIDSGTGTVKEYESELNKLESHALGILTHCGTEKSISQGKRYLEFTKSKERKQHGKERQP